MHLRSLQIHRLPGIRPGFSLDDLAQGINIVIGPNASGKSSLMRALRAVLYRQELQGVAPLFVEASFINKDGELNTIRQGSQLVWQRDGQPIDPPPLPEHRLLPCFTLRIEDLLEPENSTDTELAGRIARELAGGYDIGSIRSAEPFRLKQSHARKEAQTLRDMESTLRRRQLEQEQLLQDEASLSELKEERDEAGRAAAGVERCQRALNLLQARRQLSLVEKALADFPEGMDRLRGDELDELEKLRGQRQGREKAQKEARAKLNNARQALEDTGLEHANLDEAILDDHRQALQQLQRLETKLEQRNGELSEALSQRETAASNLGGEPGQPVHLDIATVNAIEERLRSKRELDATITALERERDRLPEQPDGGVDPESLNHARAELIRWLSAPTAPALDAIHKAAIISALGAGLAGIVVAAATVHWALLALIVPFGWGGYTLLSWVPGERERRQARERFGQTGQPNPESWESDPVHQRMNELDRQLREELRRQKLAEERLQVVNRLKQENEKRDALLADLNEFSQQVGHDPLLQDGPLDRWLRLTLAWDDAQRRVDSLGDEIDRLESQVKPLCTKVLSFLADHDESPTTGESDATTLLKRLDHLSGRLRRRGQALADIGQANRDIDRLDGEIRETDDEITTLFRKAVLAEGDETGLRRRIELRPEWSRKREDLHHVQAQVSLQREGLIDHAELLKLVETDDEEELSRRHMSLQAQAESYRELNEKIGAIGESIKSAGRERALEVARAQAQTAEDSLYDRLDEALFATAGTFLLDRVESEHVQSSQPAALKRAKNWFSHFTHYTWALDLNSDGQTRFMAIETASGERRSLSELSSGTRMQLLLAVRVAFALEAERGHEPLPLVLDEALTTADPERFQAASESLQALSDEGRQVFYLTAQPADIGYWKAHNPDVRCIDLAHERRLAGAIRESDTLTLPERPHVPPPDGQSAPDYAVSLGVPLVNPWDEPSSLHLFHILRDDLPLLYRLLLAGIERLGQAESLLASPAASTLLEPEERERLKSRAYAVRTWFEAWRTGRGRPMSYEALEETNAVSGRYLERVAELNNEVGRNGRELLARLEAGEVKGFRAAKREELREFMSDRGYLDEREPLSDSAITLQVTAATGSSDDANSVVNWLTTALTSI